MKHRVVFMETRWCQHVGSLTVTLSKWYNQYRETNDKARASLAPPAAAAGRT
jgi:hypothetical protein